MARRRMRRGSDDGRSLLGCRAPWRARAERSERVARVVVIVASRVVRLHGVLGDVRHPGRRAPGRRQRGQRHGRRADLRWHILYPAWDWYTGHAAGQDRVHLPSPVRAVLRARRSSCGCFGHRDFVVRLPAALMSRACRRCSTGSRARSGGAAAGAVAAASYVVVPIAVGFSNFLNLETFCIFGAIALLLGALAPHGRPGARRHLVASLSGVCLRVLGRLGGLPARGADARLGVAAGLRPARARSRRASGSGRTPLVGACRSASSPGHAPALARACSRRPSRSATGSGRRWAAAAARGRSSRTCSRRASTGSTSPSRRWPSRSASSRRRCACCALFVTRRDEETLRASACSSGRRSSTWSSSRAPTSTSSGRIYFAPYFALALAQLVPRGRRRRRLASVRRLSRRRAAGGGVGRARARPRAGAAMARDGVPSLWVWRRTGGRYDDNGDAHPQPPRHARRARAGRAAPHDPRHADRRAAARRSGAGSTSGSTRAVANDIGRCPRAAAGRPRHAPVLDRRAAAG